jgi:hypothetical protein
VADERIVELWPAATRRCTASNGARTIRVGRRTCGNDWPRKEPDERIIAITDECIPQILTAALVQS